MEDLRFDPTHKVLISLTKVETGENVEFEDEFGHSPEFIWGEGNYSCDCNRDLFFHRVKDKEYDPDDDDPSSRCGHSRYKVEWVKDLRSGEIVYSEE